MQCALLVREAFFQKKSFILNYYAYYQAYLINFIFIFKNLLEMF